MFNFKSLILLFLSCFFCVIESSLADTYYVTRSPSQAEIASAYASNYGGELVKFEAVFDSVSKKLTFKAFFKPSAQTGFLPKGYYMVMNNGPMPMNFDSEIIFYFDATNMGAPILTTYGYNMLDSGTSWQYGTPNGNAPDRVKSSLVSTDWIYELSARDDLATGQRIFTFSINATGLINRTPKYPPAQGAYFGTGFDHYIGAWFHWFPNFVTSYQPANTSAPDAGFLNSFSVANQGYLDMAYTITTDCAGNPRVDSSGNPKTNVAELDSCGVCNGNNASKGCDGVCGSNKVIDSCGICGGLDRTKGCDGVCGSNKAFDSCGICGGLDASKGCDGVCGSRKVVDICGVCGGTATSTRSCGCSNGQVKGCDGVCNSGKVIDSCGICGGFNQSKGCDGVCGSGITVDACGECGGNGQDCVCVGFDNRPTILAFDNRSGEMLSDIRSLIKTYDRLAPKSRSKTAFLIKARAEADVLYRNIWTEVNINVPAFVKSCPDGTSGCVKVNLDASIANLVTGSNNLRKTSDSLISKLSKIKTRKAKAAVKKYKTSIQEKYDASVLITKTLPRTSSSCR